MLGWKKSEKASGPKLRVLPAALEGYRFAFRNIGTALRLILVSAFCLTGVHVALFGLDPLASEDAGEMARLVLLGLLNMVFIVLMATIVLSAWQRRILLGPGYAKMRFGRREVRMFLAVLAIGLIVALAMAVIGILAGLLESAGIGAAGKLELVGNLVAAYFIGRLYFILPARAMDRKLGFREAWKMTANRGKELMAVVVVTGFPVAILSEVVMGVYATGLEAGAVGIIVGTAALDNVLFMLGIVAEGAAMTFCYAALGGYEHILEARRAEAEAAAETEAAPA